MLELADDGGHVGPTPCGIRREPAREDGEQPSRCIDPRRWRPPSTRGDVRRERHAIAPDERPLAAQRLVQRHEEDNVLIIGTYLDQLHQISARLEAPLITGETPQGRRDELFKSIREGRIKRLVVSKVANFAIDLPDANVAIQVSGSFGSRQEEAQRLGRILRPKKTQAYFYSVITNDSKEQEFAMKRQLFLTEQGYRYHIEERAAK